MTLDEAEAKVRAAWRGLPRDELPELIADFLVADGYAYEHGGRLFAMDGR